MQIHELKPKNRKARKTIGRGGKRGTYSGRGNKGQGARSGVSLDPLFEGGRSSLVDRMKKIRGFKSIHPKKKIVKLSDLQAKFKDGDKIDTAALIEAGLIEKTDLVRGVKLLADGKISKKLVIDKNLLISQSAQEMIEKAGGKIEK